MTQILKDFSFSSSLRALAVVFGLFVSSSAAQAQANPNNGFYFGAFLAGVFAEQEVLEITDPGPPPTLVDGTAELDAIGGTLALGYRAPISGNIIAGIEGDVTVGNFEDEYDGDQYDSNYIATIRALIGLEINSNLLLYLTGGIAFMDAKYVGDVAPPAPIMGPVSVTETLTGFAIGGGGEIKTPVGVSIRGQYLYTSFEDWNFLVNTDYYDVETDAHIAQVGIVVPFPN